ncbi:hypothetical protein [Stenotrophomonas mori]|uniref:Uncharacterized protein n=1 Tax=Stenotrophomonas mori TaxID=2871096 RepID=A0ABT0SGJ8_9GAMM|nr:hypothetical protein [Stenotrophomonas mori]MCL7714450.1 hypothetical protein [Stenotrophomonas mori]
MKSYVFSELIRAYFVAIAESGGGLAFRDPMPEEGGDVRGDIVRLGVNEIESLIRREIGDVGEGYSLLKVLYAPLAISIVLTLPVDEIAKPFFERLLYLAGGDPLVHYYYGLFVLNYSDSLEMDAVAAKHYRRAAELHEEKARKLREWAGDI